MITSTLLGAPGCKIPRLSEPTVVPHRSELVKHLTWRLRMSRILPTLQFNQSLFGLAVIAAAMMLAANAHAGTEKVLYSFTGGSDGYFSTTGVAMDSAGNIYGTTNF